MRKFKKIKFKGILSLVLAILVTIHGFLLDFTPSTLFASSANDRVTTFIKLAKGQSIFDADSNEIESLSEDELRFLGVYLSNFFIPFGTELGISADNEDTLNQMKQALSKNMNWNEDLCSILCEHILGLSRSSDRELKIYASKGYMDGNYSEVKDLNCNYFNFVRIMMGYYDLVNDGYRLENVNNFINNTLSNSDINKGVLLTSPDYIKLSEAEKKNYTEVKKDGVSFYVRLEKGPLENYNYCYFGYETSSGQIIPVIDAALSKTIVTASQASFRQIIGNTNIEKGYGFSFFDLTTDEVELDEISNIDMDISDLLNLSIYGDKMYVDCFGNIIKKGKVHQYIAIPACMNPYVWTPVDEEGNDCLEPGIAYNLINFMSMSLADNEDLLIPTDCKFDNHKNGILDKQTSTTGNKLKEEKYEASSYKTRYTSNGNVCKGINLSMFPLFVNYDKTLEKIRESWTLSHDGLLGFWDKEATAEGFSLRMLRGTKTSSLTEEYDIKWWQFWKNDSDSVPTWAKTIKLLEEEYKNLYPKDKSYYMSGFGGLDVELKDNSEVGLLRQAMSSEVFIIEGEKSSLLQLEFTDTKSLISCTNYSEDRLYLLDNIIMIDNLGVFNTDNGGKADFSSINFIHYLDDMGKPPISLLKEYNQDINNGYGNTINDIVSGKMNSEVNVSEAAVASVYTTYLIAGLYSNSTDTKKNTIGKLGFRLNKEGLPEINNTPIVLPGDYQVNVMDEAIREWSYYLLHPTKGMHYVSTLIKNKTEAFLVDWHNDMVGTKGVGVTTGTTAYKSTVGYVTTPDLSEVQWTSNLINFYGKAIPYLVVVMLLLMLFSYIAGILNIQKALFGLVIFSTFLFMPTIVINSVVGISNNVVQKIYGEKLTYWALVQEESYATVLDEAASGESYENYLRSLYALNSETYINQGGDSIVLKWQAPKKMASLIFTKKDSEILDGLQNSKLVSWVLNNNTMSGENYINNGSYLFRSYADLSNIGRFIYNGISKGNVKTTNIYDSELQDKYKNYKQLYDSYISLGYNNPNQNNSSNIENAYRVSVPITGKLYSEASKFDLKNISALNSNTCPGIHQAIFNFGLPVFTNSSLTFKESIENGQGYDEYAENYLNSIGSLVEENLTGLATYGIMSESPYYYFSWNLYDQGMSTEANARNGYKNLLLGDTENNYFYNTKGNGELKDFMDMRSLFTIVIPYLREGNNLVKEFDNTYGLSLYDGVPTEEGHWNDVGMKDVNNNPTELYKKYWHNVSVARLYEIYTPWVDLMYDCDYAQPTKIRALGNEYVIDDPLNPYSYPKERPMIFSESEMYDYGLSEADLTEVEKRILKANKEMCTKMFELLNYVNFRDFTLNTAAAMECTFAFNNNFSQSTKNINIYPQSFEINNFSYDAFLRLILSNTTGEDLTNSNDFYLTVVQKSSLTTAIVLIINDIISQYVFTGFKIFFLIAEFIAMILLIVLTAFKIDVQQNYVKKLIKGSIIPMLGFLATNIIFAWVLSMFMGVGNNAVTQSNIQVIQMGDPVIVLLLMVVINVACMISYYKLVKVVVSEIKINVSLLKGFIGGVAEGVFSNTTKIVNKFKKNSSNSIKSNDSINESGTNRVSERAINRTNTINSIDERHEESNSRIKEAERDIFRQNSNSKKNTKNKQDINKKIEEGNEKLNYSSENN